MLGNDLFFVYVFFLVLQHTRVSARERGRERGGEREWKRSKVKLSSSSTPVCSTSTSVQDRKMMNEPSNGRRRSRQTPDGSTMDLLYESTNSVIVRGTFLLLLEIGEKSHTGIPLCRHGCLRLRPASGAPFILTGCAHNLTRRTYDVSIKPPAAQQHTINAFFTCVDLGHSMGSTPF